MLLRLDGPATWEDRCIGCGHDSEEIVGEVHDAGGREIGPVCLTCLHAGPATVAAGLQEEAEMLEAQARLLRIQAQQLGALPEWPGSG